MAGPVGVTSIACAGVSNLVPGGPVAILRESRHVLTALMVDVAGFLNAASLDLRPGGQWRGPDEIGTAGLVPGAPVTVFHAQQLWTALTVDRDGVLCVASLDPSSGGRWDGPNPVGTAVLAPGAPVAVIRQSGQRWLAVTTDRNGILTTAWFDATAGDGWKGPVASGGGPLEAGSYVAVLG